MNNRRGPGFSGGGLGFGGPRGPIGRGPGRPGFGGPRGPMGRGPGGPGFGGPRGPMGRGPSGPGFGRPRGPIGRGPGFGPMGPGGMNIFGWNQRYRRNNTGCMTIFILGLVILGGSIYGVI